MRGPEVWVIWDRGVFSVQALRRRIEQAEAFAGDAGDDFCGHPTPRPGFADAQ